MSEIALIYVVYGDRPSAEGAARAMIEQRLAACANILADGQSIYSWQGSIEEAREVAVLFKTALTRRDALMAALAGDHAYDLPAIISWSAMTTPDYAAWVAGETTGETGL